MKIRRLYEKLDKNTGLEIEYATLLSIDKAEELPLRLRKYNNWWWLRSPGIYQDLAAFVHTDGTVYYYGDRVHDDDNCVRPALIFSNLDSTKFKIGDKFKFGGVKFEIINENMAFCLEDIGECPFRKDWVVEEEEANDYEESDVKEFVDNWFNNAN